MGTLGSSAARSRNRHLQGFVVTDAVVGFRGGAPAALLLVDIAHNSIAPRAFTYGVSRVENRLVHHFQNRIQAAQTPTKTSPSAAQFITSDIPSARRRALWDG